MKITAAFNQAIKWLKKIQTNIYFANRRRYFVQINETSQKTIDVVCILIFLHNFIFVFLIIYFSHGFKWFVKASHSNYHPNASFVSTSRLRVKLITKKRQIFINVHIIIEQLRIEKKVHTNLALMNLPVHLMMKVLQSQCVKIYHFFRRKVFH